MSTLKPVSFARPVTPAPRLSEPYVPGKRHRRYWTPQEDAVLHERYPEGGIAACQPHLPAHHATPSAIYQRATNLGLNKKGISRPQRIVVTDDFDERLREEWTKLDGRKKGEVGALADRLDVPRWWLTNRATKLGLTIPHKKEPRWTAAEDDLMRRVPLHQPDACARIFRDHGFARSPTAIVVRAKRLDLSRRAARPELSATKAAAILGVDLKWITAFCISGELIAVKRDDRRLPQQGGSAWDIQPADFRRFILDHLERIDLRKVEKFAFVDLIANGGEA